VNLTRALHRFISPAIIVALAVAAGASAGAQPATVVLRIATPGNDGNALAFYAQDLGIFKKDGIESQIQAMRAGGGPSIAAAVAGGAVDIGETDIITVASAREHGIPLTLLAPSFTHRSAMAITAVIVGKDSPIRTASELNGKVIGVPSLSGPAKVATDKWLLKNGVDISTVKFVEVPQVTMAAAVTRGTVAAATTNEPSLTATIDEVRVLGYPYDAIGNGIQVTAWCATEDWVRTHPDLARRFVAAIHEAAVWANKPENHAASGAILLKYTPFPAELLPKMHRATYGEIFDPALMQPVLDAALDEKSIAKHIAAKELLSAVVLTK
jgi:NitT/TauT family transport system substrate-binding protein